ncbi:hypothetical protein [Streptomyces syringium]|uniref:hypothetical protein n=1 Tax=Streptomyces syringium TaxID=76729 RepID=UPI0037D6A445
MSRADYSERPTESEECPECDGTGEDPSGDECWECGGTGEINSDDEPAGQR